MSGLTDQISEPVALLRRSARARRAWARAPRYLLAGFLVITSLAGVRTILAPADAAPPPGAEPVRDYEAEAYAVELARAYLTYDAARPELRERRLRGLVPDELAPDAGFLPRRGARQVLWAEVADVQRRSDGLVVVVAVQTDSSPEPLRLAAPVGRTPRGELRLTGYPALLGAPAVAGRALPELAEVEDAELVAVASRVITNYLAGERANLAADLLPEAEGSAPDERLRVRDVLEVAWLGDPASGRVQVTVEASDSTGALYTLGYELGIAERRGRPYVSFIATKANSSPRRDQ